MKDLGSKLDKWYREPYERPDEEQPKTHCFDCNQTIPTDDIIDCDNCFNGFCKDCLEDDWKDTGWMMCKTCKDIDPWLEDLLDRRNQEIDRLLNVIKNREETIASQTDTLIAQLVTINRLRG